MLKAKLIESKGSFSYLFGLTEEDIALLKAGNIVCIDMAIFGQHGETVIVYGKTNEDIVHKLQKSGANIVGGGVN